MYIPTHSWDSLHIFTTENISQKKKKQLKNNLQPKKYLWITLKHCITYTIFFFFKNLNIFVHNLKNSDKHVIHLSILESTEACYINIQRWHGSHDSYNHHNISPDPVKSKFLKSKEKWNKVTSKEVSKGGRKEGRE